MRIATFNGRHGAPADHKVRRGDPEAFAEACASLNADILALQEVERGVRRSKHADLAALAAEASGMEVVYGKTMRAFFGSFGNALLVRGKIEEYEVVNLKEGSLVEVNLGNHQFKFSHDRRNAIFADVLIGEKRLSVVNTHLSTERQASRQQLAKIVTRLACYPEPQLLLGDLNLTKDDIPGFPTVGSLEFAEGPPTFPAPKPRRAIDHIAVNGLTITSLEVVRLGVSDHRALVAEIV